MHTSTETGMTPRATGAAERVRVAVAGATGFTGQELLRILARHPHVSIVAATSSGATAARKLPALNHLFRGAIVPLEPESLAGEADVIFLALPDTAAAELAPKFSAAGARVIDLSGALRLKDEALRKKWYPETHALPDGLAYGLTEHARDEVRDARVVANPGCYPTAALLALKPLVAAGVLVPGADVIVDAKSGVSGAGKTPTERTHFSEVYASLSAYGVLNHRHGAEIEQGFGGEVTFTPHLLPIDRGILETIYVRVKPGTTEEQLGEIYDAAYGRELFVRVVGSALPEIKHVAHTNFCDIGWKVNASGRAVIVSVIDNLVKGASGQAVQNMNVMIGAPEEAGLL
ncbi:MAG: N-acetyl-gamma-glutamyl-phosphate reductase [Vicinamibacterales bacterium]